MSTNALITLHGLSKGHNGKSSMHTVTLYRHCDGGMDRTFAAFLYSAMDNERNAKGGYFDAFMCADPSEVEYFDQLDYTLDDCCSEYHYHFNAETLELVVNHADEYNNVPQHVAFKGSIAEFINKYSCEKKAVISYNQYAQNQKTCLTREGIIRTVTKCFADIQRLNQPLNPNHKSWLKTIDRFLIILDEMELSPEARDWRKTSMDLSMGYYELTQLKEKAQQREALKNELNTTHVMMGEQPVSITILN